MGILEIVITVFSLLYVFFAARNKAICFLFGGIAAACWAYESFFNLNLKFDALLQIFYVGMSIYGAYHWSNGDKNETTAIQKLDSKSNILIVILGFIVSFACAKVALYFFDTNYAYLDALTTGFSIIATFLLARRYIENWLYWLVINPIYMMLYFKSGGTLLAGISIVYTIMAIKGFIDWQKELRLMSIPK